VTANTLSALINVWEALEGPTYNCTWGCDQTRIGSTSASRGRSRMLVIRVPFAGVKRALVLRHGLLTRRRMLMAI
jgi:hypothetical protein